MDSRRYQVAFFIAKVAELISWVLMIGGIILSIYLASSENIRIGAAVFVAALLVGIMFVFFSQITLIYIDTENNTRQIAEEIKKTNAMLSETLGVMASCLGKIAERDQS